MKKHKKNKPNLNNNNFYDGNEMQSNGGKCEFLIKERFKYTEKQINIIKIALEKDTRAIFCDGIWGSGKSFIAVLIALKLLSHKKINGIIYIRNPIESSSTSKIGSLPGSILEKMEPYNQIFFDKLSELLTSPDLDKLKKSNKIECIPLGYARGLSWESKVVIVDEAASLTYDDILLLLTRCGDHTRIIFIGDSINQNDIGTKSGFRKIYNLFSDEESKNNGVFTFELNQETDIVRSGFVRFVMKKTGKIVN